MPLIWSLINYQIIQLSKDPGRIWPGKRMPGRMGGKTTNTLNLKVSQSFIQVSSMFTNINHLEEHKLMKWLHLNYCMPGKLHEKNILQIWRK